MGSGATHFLRRARGEWSRRHNAITVNGMRGPRRSARRARIALATLLGGDIDGTWWPHTASVAGELPELVDALQRPTEPLWQQGLRQPHPDQDPVGVLNAQWGRPARHPEGTADPLTICG
jgi:hypothetical protein